MSMINLTVVLPARFTSFSLFSGGFSFGSDKCRKWHYHSISEHRNNLSDTFM